jgi:hypothetical protein
MTKSLLSYFSSTQIILNYKPQPNLNKQELQTRLSKNQLLPLIQPSNNLLRADSHKINGYSYPRIVVI